MNTTRKTIHDLENVKKAGIGFELLDSTPGAFIVLECCSYDEPTEVARFNHDGTAHSRSLACSKAVNSARSSQAYDGTQCDYNVYEEIEAPDGGLAGLTPDELREVIRVAKEIPRDLRRKQVRLATLRTLERFDSPDNPYHIYPNPVTDRVWNPVFLGITSRLNTTASNMDDLAKRALALLCPYNPGDRVVYAGSICLVTSICSDGRIILDRYIEVTPEEIRLADIEPARDVAGIGNAAIAEDIERESNDPRSTKPTARGYLASLISNQIDAYKRYGHRFDDAVFLYHLDNCSAYGVLSMQDHAAINEHIKKRGFNDYRALIEALCGALLTGAGIANSLLSVEN
ncbi:hypothetical protein SB5439_05126 [Klebsiella variicola]|uniref:hypothetical protein n=1 Tax=Klebsiella variicola TaxID=244366 RepID=UPI0010F21B80|nr:hypothetical protein [Klebsiella variicola]VGQ13007.1 hypothetical protein SB5439_05126 [Klebsiella variicola]